MTTYEDIVGQKVHVRLRECHHREWEICKVIEIVSAGIKLKCFATKEFFIIANNDVRNDLRLLNAFVPWEKQQKLYDGIFLLFIHGTSC